MTAFALLLVIAFTGLESARAQQSLQVLHNHVRHEVTQGQARLAGAMPENEQLSFSIVLPPRNESELDQLLDRLYDPSSRDYREFLSVAEFTERFGPTVQDYAAVVAFAKASGFEVTGTPANRMVVPVRGTVGAINRAFHLRMNLYQHPTENRTFFSPDREPSLSLSVPVAHLAGLNNFSLPRPLVQRSTEGHAGAVVTGSGPGGSYLASDMRAAYYGGTQLTGDGQAVGLLEFGGYYMSDVDGTFGSAGQSYSVPINNVLLDGALAEPGADEEDAEQVLDIVQAIGMAPGLSQVRVYIGVGMDDANVLNAMASENIAKALSCSWGWIPDDPATDDVFFKEFAAQGQSFFAASGDSGAFDVQISPYFYPGEDANVTAVGGTHLTTSGAGGAWSAETAWNTPPDGSGGGVSPDGIAIPSWQTGLATSANGASTTLRNVPDVAMEGDFDNFVCALGICQSDYAGTSFAAPRWAGFIALVNQQAVEAGTAPAGGVGFLNPSIYSIGTDSKYANDFHDIVSGNNLTNAQPVWYNAVTGYDLVTGWGSPAGLDLINDLAGKQAPGFWLTASAPTVAMNPGKSGSTTISIVDAGGLTGTVQLAITSALPSGVTAKWGTNPASKSSVLTLTSASTAPNTTTTLTIAGTSGSITETTQITLIVHTPTFSLSTAPGSVAMSPGSSAAAAVAVTPLYRFSGSVKLSVSGLPSGVTATLGTNPTTGTSILTIQASSTAATGTSNVTITGVSGSVTVTTVLPLEIHDPAFALTNSGDLYLGPGTTAGTYIVVLDEFGFSAGVNFSVSGLPSGVTASFTPNPTTGYSVLAVTASSSAALGASTLTVTGTSGSLTATTTLTLNVLAPTFTLSNAGAVNMGQGKTATTWVYVNSRYGFSSGVQLAISGLPSGVTAFFAPNPATGYSLLTLTASSSAKLGASTVTVTGTSGSLKESTSFPLAVFVPTFTLSTSASMNLGQGASASASILLSPEYGFTGSTQLAVSGLPSGVTASISPNPITYSAVLTLTASSTAPVSTSTVTITGVAGTQTASTTLSLAVLTPTFTVTGPGPVNLGEGTSVSSSVAVTPEYGFMGSVSLATSGLPSGVDASFSPNPTTGASALTLKASSAAKAGNYIVKLIGTSGAQTATTTFPVTIAAPGFTLSNGGSIQLGQGTTSNGTNITVNPESSFTGSVHLAISGLPSGVTASFSPDVVTGYSTLTLTASPTATVGSATITVTGVSGTLTETTTIPLEVGAPTFTVSPPGGASVIQGGTASTYFSVTPAYGFTGSVNFSVSGLPAGVTASFSPNPTTGYTTFTLAASSTATLGIATVTVKAASGSHTVSVNFPLTVSAPSLTVSSQETVQLAPGSQAGAYIGVYQGQGVTNNVKLAVSGLPTGVTASFSPNPTSSSSTLTFTAASTAAAGTTTVTVTGTQGSLTATTTIQLQVHAPAFTLSAPSTVYLSQSGTSANYVQINSQFGFAGAVILSVSGLPAGVTASWSPNPTTYGSTLTLTASSTAALAGKTVTITGVSGSLSASTPLQLAVVSPSFTVNDYGTVSVGLGTSSTSSVYVDSQNGFSGNVNLSVTGLPSGVTASFSPSSTNYTSILTLTSSNAVSPGQYNAVLTGTYGSLTSSTPLLVTVIAPSFTLWESGNLQLGRGSSTTVTTAVYPQNGFTGSVLLSALGLPAGVSASFSPNPTATGNTMTLTASKTATLGEYNATIVGTYGKLTVSQPVNISVYTPAFTLNGYQWSNLAPGSTGQANINVNPEYGFLGSVNLSASGLPSGVTASFSVNPVTSASELTLKAGSTAVPGEYNVLITGVSGTQTATMILPITISTPSFSLWGEGVSVGQGESATTFVSVSQQNGFSAAVQLTVSGLPSGVTASFSPNPTTSGGTLTLTASASATAGQYTVIITGKGGGMTVKTQIPVTVAPPSFTLYGASSLSLGVGKSTTGNVYVNPQLGFTGSVNFAVTGLPSGIAASFSPNPTTSSALLTLTASSAVAAGQYNATIIGISGTQSASMPLVVTTAAPGFTLWGAGDINLGQGTSTTSSISVQPAFGFNGTVHFAVSGLPSGVTASFSPVSSTTGTTLTLTASSAAVIGEYVATITGSSGAATATVSLNLTVAQPSFALTDYGSFQIYQGTSTSAGWIEVSPQFGFTGSVDLTASGLPSGVTASFSPNSATSNSAMTLTASDSAKPGQYNFKIIGTSGSQSASLAIPLTVSVPTFTLFSTGSVNLGQGTSATTYIYVNNGSGFTGSVKLGISGLPSGVTASFSSDPATYSNTLTLTASSTATLGQYNVTVTGTSGTQSVSTTVSVAVYVPTFTLSSWNSVDMVQGASTTASITVNPDYGFAGEVQLSISGLPSGVTASFSSDPATYSNTLTLTASSTATLGQYNVTVTGTSGTQSASTVLALEVDAPTVATSSTISVNRKGEHLASH